MRIVLMNYCCVNCIECDNNRILAEVKCWPRQWRKHNFAQRPPKTKHINRTEQNEIRKKSTDQMLKYTTHMCNGDM